MQYEFSIAGGFVEISECLAEMIKFIANEPSDGLRCIQKHTHSAVPPIIHHKKNLLQKCRETALQTEDLEDSVTMVRSMKECGCPIVDDMIGDIKKTLSAMPTKQLKRGLLHNLAFRSPDCKE